MNRRIDGINYNINEPPPIELPVKLVLQFVTYTMNSGYSNRKKMLFYMLKPGEA